MSFSLSLFIIVAISTSMSYASLTCTENPCLFDCKGGGWPGSACKNEELICPAGSHCTVDCDNAYCWYTVVQASQANYFLLTGCVGNDCKNMNIHCPSTSNPNNKKCIIDAESGGLKQCDCNQPDCNCDTQIGTAGLNIYATNSWNDIDVTQFTGNLYVGSSGGTMHCSTGSCLFKANNNIWTCEPSTASCNTLPTNTPTKSPTIIPSKSPTPTPTDVPTLTPPTKSPTPSPTNLPSIQPTTSPADIPTTGEPSTSPTLVPTQNPLMLPTIAPTHIPTNMPTLFTNYPTSVPTNEPIMFMDPTKEPSMETSIGRKEKEGNVAVETTKNKNMKENDELDLSVIIGVTIGICIVIVMIILVIIYFRKKKGHNKMSNMTAQSVAAELTNEKTDNNVMALIKKDENAIKTQTPLGRIGCDSFVVEDDDDDDDEMVLEEINQTPMGNKYENNTGNDIELAIQPMNNRIVSLEGGDKHKGDNKSRLSKIIQDDMIIEDTKDVTNGNDMEIMNGDMEIMDDDVYEMNTRQ